jgi:sugar (pentulose or hexulose) kinase
MYLTFMENNKMSPKNLVIGLDSSTTACKALVWDTQGRLLAEGRSPIPLVQPRPAWHEQPAAAWWSACVEALQQVTAQIDPARLAGLCISPQRETFVPVDAQGEPLRPALIWMDQRCGPLLPDIGQQLGLDYLLQETGKPLSGNLSLGKIAWLRRYEPDIFKRAAKYLDVAGYLHYHLTGFYRTGWGCADPMGLFDMRQNCWSAHVLDFLGLTAAQLPDAYPPTAILGEVTAEAARLTGLLAGLPVVAGVGDGQAAGLGVNVTGPGQAYLNLGTSVISGTYTAAYHTDRTHRTMYSAVPGAYILETAVLGGAYIINWLIEKIAGGRAKWPADESPEAMFDRAAQKIAPGADGLLLVPYWNSVMNPYWDAAASGIMVGWRGFHTLEHIYRAILEGIGFELRLHLHGVEASLEGGVERFIAVGGGAKSTLWGQVIADITNKPVYISAVADASALGAAIQAAYGVGLFSDITMAAQTMTRLNPTPFTPDPARVSFYTSLYEQVYQHLFPALQPYLQNLTRLSGGYND